MNGGKIKKLSARKAREKRIREQNRVFNFLRLAYYLSPEKLKAEGIKVKNIDNSYINRILLDVGVPEKSWFEAAKRLKNYVVFQTMLIGILDFAIKNKKMPITTKRADVLSAIKEDLVFPLWHQIIMPLVLKGRNPKCTDLEWLANKVVTFQDFEIKKLTKDIEGKKPQSYFDYLEKSLGKQYVGYEVIYLRSAIKKAKKREKYWQKEVGYSYTTITDKDVALVLYKNASGRVLQRVRQDRRRLKKYRFI